MTLSIQNDTDQLVAENGPSRYCVWPGPRKTATDAARVSMVATGGYQGGNADSHHLNRHAMVSRPTTPKRHVRVRPNPVYITNGAVLRNTLRGEAREGRSPFKSRSLGLFCVADAPTWGPQKCGGYNGNFVAR